VPTLRIGYFEEFKSNTLLSEADADGLRALAELFRSLAAGTLDNLAPLPFVEPHHRVLLTATRSALDLVTRRAHPGRSFLWKALSTAGVMRPRSSMC
jgi:hypothetical protein